MKSSGVAAGAGSADADGSDDQNAPVEASTLPGAGGTGSALVPLLEHGGQYVIESTVVARYIAQHIGGRIFLPPVKIFKRIQHAVAVGIRACRARNKCWITAHFCL